MKILLAVDGSEYTRKMLDYVVDHKGMFDPSHEYVLFNAQHPLPPHARASLGADVVQGYHHDEAEKVLQPALEILKTAGLRASSEWAIGTPGETIGERADDGGFSMVIMGSHGHRALARLVMGSVASEVLAHCGVPVLLVR